MPGDRWRFFRLGGGVSVPAYLHDYRQLKSWLASDGLTLKQAHANIDTHRSASRLCRAENSPHMRVSDPIDAREAQIARILGSEHDIAALREHVKVIVHGPAFKGSVRSGQFLQYVVDQSIAGRFDSLKERLIGVELFGRSPSYDTGEDAIVRVTASDVRKRLLQHYGMNGAASEFRITLPLGSYIPEIVRDKSAQANLLDPLELPREAWTSSLLDHPVADPARQQAGNLAVLPDLHDVPEKRASRSIWPLASIIALVAIGVTGWALYFSRLSHTDAHPIPPYPWSTLFNPSHATNLITSDPNIVALQEVAGSELSLSDYANHKYIPEPNKLSPDVTRFFKTILWGDNSAAGIDAPIAAKIAALPHTGTAFNVRAARSIQFSDLKNDDNFIFLGSPRSDPWFDLFSDELDFKFVFDQATGQEIVANVHPRANELQRYVPTALGWATGRSFAIIAFVQNPDQNGQVLLLAGADGEGTEAAGKLATDLPRFSSVLRNCASAQPRANQHFEILLQLNTMTGTPSNVSVVACHLLPGNSTQKQ